MLEDAYARHIHDIQHKLFRVAYTILRNEADCADAVQEALIKGWLKKDSLREECYFDTWLIRILINECYGFIRKRKRRNVQAASARPPQMPDVANVELHNALMKLGEQERLPLMLHYSEGYAVHEIAAMVGIPEGTVKSRMNRARNKLRELLKDEVDGL